MKRVPGGTGVENDAGKAHLSKVEKTVTRRSLLVNGGKFATFVTPSLIVLVEPEDADACHKRKHRGHNHGHGNGSGSGHGSGHGSGSGSGSGSGIGCIGASI
jgi:hypothetical protein